MSSKTGYPMVVSDAEIDLAVEALRRLPGRKHLPRAWDRTKVIEQIRLAVGPAPVPDLAYQVAPGIDAVVAPFGSDKLGAALDDRWQVLLLVRQAPPGSRKLVELGEIEPQWRRDITRRRLTSSLFHHRCRTPHARRGRLFASHWSLTP